MVRRTGWGRTGVEATIFAAGALTVFAGVTTTVRAGVVTTGTRITGCVAVDRCVTGDVTAACGAGSGAGSLVAPDVGAF